MKTKAVQMPSEANLPVPDLNHALVGANSYSQHLVKCLQSKSCWKQRKESILIKKNDALLSEFRSIKTSLTQSKVNRLRVIIVPVLADLVQVLQVRVCVKHGHLLY